MSDYSEFFFNSKATVVELETIEISHPNFSTTFRVVRNNYDGMFARLEGGELVRFDYYPLEIKKSTSSDDLDFAFSISFGDLGEVIPFEIDAVRAADNFNVKPIFVYRTYRSDDLDNVLYGPIQLEVKTCSFTKEGCTLEVKAQSLNVNRTGECYVVDRFPMLGGIL